MAVDDYVHKGFLISWVLASSLGAFQFGYSLGVFNTLGDLMEIQLEWTNKDI